MTPVTETFCIQGSPWRLQAFFVSSAYHTWLGKASRPQTLRDHQQILKPYNSRLLGKALFWHFCSSVSLQHTQTSPWLDSATDRFAYIVLWAASRLNWISHAAWHAFLQQRSATTFFFLFNFPHKRFWFLCLHMGFETSTVGSSVFVIFLGYSSRHLFFFTTNTGTGHRMDPLARASDAFVVAAPSRPRCFKLLICPDGSAEDVFIYYMGCLLH